MAEKDVDSKGAAWKDVDSKGDAGKDVDSKGGSHAEADLVDGIVSRAAALGGWLIVSIVSPLPANGRRFASSGSGPSSALKDAADKVGKRELPPGLGSEPAVQPVKYSKTNPGPPK